MPVGTLTEANLEQIAAAPHRQRTISNVSAKSIDKAISKFGLEAA